MSSTAVMSEKDFLRLITDYAGRPLSQEERIAAKKSYADRIQNGRPDVDGRPDRRDVDNQFLTEVAQALASLARMGSLSCLNKQEIDPSALAQQYEEVSYRA